MHFKMYLSLRLQLPQISLLHQGIMEKVDGRVLKDNRACLKDIPAMGNGKGHIGILLHKKDGHPFPIEVLDEIKDLFNKERGKSH